MAEATYGLRLAIGGAPLEAHAVEGVAGALFRPDIPTPVGGEGQITLERARELAEDPAVPLELVELAAETAETAVALAEAALVKARAGIAIAVQQGLEGADLSRLYDEYAIVTTPPTAGAERIGTPDPPTTNPDVNAVVSPSPAASAPAPADQPAADSAPSPAAAVSASSDTPTTPPDDQPDDTTTTEG